MKRPIMAALIAALAFSAWLLPGSSIIGGTFGAIGIWRARRRRQLEMERWNSLTGEQQLDEVLPADWRTRTMEETYPERLQ